MQAVTLVRTTKEVRTILDATIKELHGLNRVREEAVARPLKHAIHGVLVTALAQHAVATTERESAVLLTTDRKLELMSALSLLLSTIEEEERKAHVSIDPRIYIDQMKARGQTRKHAKQLELGLLQNDSATSVKRMEVVASELSATYEFLTNLGRLEALYEGASITHALRDL